MSSSKRHEPNFYNKSYINKKHLNSFVTIFFITFAKGRSKDISLALKTQARPP